MFSFRRQFLHWSELLKGSSSLRFPLSKCLLPGLSNPTCSCRTLILFLQKLRRKAGQDSIAIKQALERKEMEKDLAAKKKGMLLSASYTSICDPAMFGIPGWTVWLVLVWLLEAWLSITRLLDCWIVSRMLQSPCVSIHRYLYLEPSSHDPPRANTLTPLFPQKNSKTPGPKPPSARKSKSTRKPEPTRPHGTRRFARVNLSPTPRQPARFREWGRARPRRRARCRASRARISPRRGCRSG